MYRVWFGLLGAGAVIAVACSNPTGNGNGCGGNGTNAVVITAHDNQTFTPQTVQVSQTQQICFQNLGTVLHTVTPDSEAPVDTLWIRGHPTESLPPNSPYQFTLGVGDYYYHCAYHGGNQTGMWGVIHVR